MSSIPPAEGRPLAGAPVREGASCLTIAAAKNALIYSKDGRDWYWWLSYHSPDTLTEWYRRVPYVRYDPATGRAIG